MAKIRVISQFQNVFTSKQSFYFVVALIFIVAFLSLCLPSVSFSDEVPSSSPSAVTEDVIKSDEPNVARDGQSVQTENSISQPTQESIDSNNLPLKPVPDSPVVTEKSSEVLSVEELEAKLMKKAPKALMKLKDALRALEQKRYATGLKSIAKIKDDPDYGDYYHFVSALIEHARMKDFLKKKQWASALSTGRQTVYHFTNVMSANAYTPLEKKTLMLTGEVELAMAEVQLSLKRKNTAMKLFESAFQHLTNAKLLALVGRKSILNYARLCEHKVNDICTGWEIKLAPFLDKNDDTKILDRIRAFKPPELERSTTRSYRVDLDLQKFQTGFQYYLEKKYDRAFSEWDELLKDYPQTNIRYRTLFWMARAAQKANQLMQAETLFRSVIRDLPFSYYGLLSSWMGNIDLSRMMSAELPEVSLDNQYLTPQDFVHLRRAEQLIALKAVELARFELKEIPPRTNMTNDFLVYLAVLNHMAKNHNTVFQIFGELSRRNYKGLFSRYGQKILFPLDSLPLLEKEAKKQNVDPLFILSVIRQESAFNPEAVSWAGAYGLMQLIRPTAKDLDPRIEVSELFDPAKNVSLGIAYISQLLLKFKDDAVLALAGYNAGPTNAYRWRKNNPQDLAPEEFIELITFKETREYVQNILRNYYWYNRKMRSEKLSNLSELITSASSGFSRTPSSVQQASSVRVIKIKNKSSKSRARLKTRR